MPLFSAAVPLYEVQQLNPVVPSDAHATHIPGHMVPDSMFLNIAVNPLSGLGSPCLFSATLYSCPFLPLPHTPVTTGWRDAT